MAKFFAFYRAGMDPLKTAQTFADEAGVHAMAVKKTVTATAVDVSSGNGSALKYWSGNGTIECVTVGDDGAKNASAMNPTALGQIDAMIDAL